MPHVNKQMISFFLTSKCNLKCVYCYNSKERAQFEEKNLSFDIAKAGIDYFFSTNNSRHIRFYGPGEPTQAFSLLRKITNYAKQKAGSQLKTEIQTNGVFGKKVLEWMLDNMNIMWISFDGPPEIQNANRPLPGGRASSPIIENNVRWLNTNKGERNLMVGARVTITDKNVTQQKEIVDYFYSLGIMQIWTDPLFPTVDMIPVLQDEEKRNHKSLDLNTYVDNYIEANIYAKQFGVFYGSFLACNFDGVTNRHCRSCTPVPHLTPDGYISACDMVTFGENAHHMDCFVYGKWNSYSGNFDFDQQKINALQNRCIENMTHCSKCKARYQCGGYCLGEIVNETGNLLGQKPNTCEAVCRLYDELGPSTIPFDYFHP